MSNSMPTSLPAGVVFDMDGLLLDSERLARHYFLEACAEFGISPDLDVYQRCIGSSYAATEAIMRESYGPAFPFEAVSGRWSALYEAHILDQPVPVKPGAVRLLATLAAAGIPCALATSTKREHAVQKLRLAELLQSFPVLVCGGEAARGKPHPDPYLLACERLGYAPTVCWALEDSMNGTRAALAAGLTVMQIPDLVIPTAVEAAEGQRILPSLEDVTDLLI